MTTSTSDLYDRTIKLLYDIKIVQGGTALASTLRRHSIIKQYLLKHQIQDIKDLESLLEH